MQIAFDIDGTLLVGELRKIHIMSFVRVLQGFGVEVSVDELPKYAGLIDFLIMKDLLESHGVKTHSELILELLGKLSEVFKEYVKEFHPEVELVPGAREFLEELSKKHRLLVITGNTPEIAKEKLKSAGLWHYFSGGVFGNIPVGSRKELGEIAVRKFGKIDWVFGDTPRDFDLAMHIDARCVLLATTHSKEELEGLGAELVIKDYLDPRLRELFNLSST